jgi:hypothetical protein
MLCRIICWPHYQINHNETNKHDFLTHQIFECVTWWNWDLMCTPTISALWKGGFNKLIKLPREWITATEHNHCIITISNWDRVKDPQHLPPWASLMSMSFNKLAGGAPTNSAHPPPQKKNFTHEIKLLFHDLPAEKRTTGCQFNTVKNNYLYDTNMCSYNTVFHYCIF